MEVENRTEFDCSKCSFSSQNIEDLERHDKSHAVIYSFGEPTEEYLKGKQKKATGGKRYSCRDCNFETDFIVHLKQHSCKVFVCSKCPFTTQSKFKYSIHSCVRQASKSEKSLAEDNNNSEASTSLTQTTNNTNVFKCEYCDFESKSKGLLRLHGAVHDQVLFNCPVCSFSTAFETLYNNHKLSHEGKKIPCPVCPFISIHKSEFINHCREEHSSESKSSAAKRSLSNARTNNTKRQNLGKREKDKTIDVSSSVGSINKLSKSSKYYTCSLCSYKTMQELSYGKHLLDNHHVALFTTIKNVLGKERLPPGFRQNVTPQDIVSLLTNVTLIDVGSLSDLYAERDTVIHWTVEEKKELYWCALYARSSASNNDASTFSKRRRAVLKARGVMDLDKIRMTTDARFNSMVANIKMERTKITEAEKREIERDVRNYIESL